jgi:hypothetical protein
MDEGSALPKFLQFSGQGSSERDALVRVRTTLVSVSQQCGKVPNVRPASWPCELWPHGSTSRNLHASMSLLVSLSVAWISMAGVDTRMTNGISYSYICQCSNWLVAVPWSIVLFTTFFRSFVRGSPCRCMIRDRHKAWSSANKMSTRLLHIFEHGLFFKRFDLSNKFCLLRLTS